MGEIVFEKAGVYTYTISELNTGADGWEYDNTIYTLTVAVTLGGRARSMLPTP